MIPVLRQLVRAVLLRSRSPWFPVRLAVGVLGTCLFTAVYFLVRLRAAVQGPWHVPAESLFGTRMNCLLPDFVQLYVYLFGVWEPDISDFVRRTLKPGDTFVDVGAHAGYYSLLASQLVGTVGHVVSVEASPFIFELLRENLGLAADATSHVRVINAVAAGDRGELCIHLGPARNLGWSTTLGERGLKQEALVPGAPLDELLTENEILAARLFKIDVEGNERDVIAGMTGILETCRPEAEFLLELSPRWWRAGELSPENVLAPFFAAGFHAYRVDNAYVPWRYFWPHSVRAPQRITTPLTSWIGQYDLVLSRVDEAELTPKRRIGRDS